MEDDYHGTLVLHRILRTEGKKVDDAQRNNIFHLWTSVKGGSGSINVIIDGGSSMNVASQHLVDKLGLKPVKHPKPYNVNWIDDTSKQVTHQVLLSFFLGKNCLEEVWYDVMPMKVGHVRRRTPMALRSRCYL